MRLSLKIKMNKIEMAVNGKDQIMTGPKEKPLYN